MLHDTHAHLDMLLFRMGYQEFAERENLAKSDNKLNRDPSPNLDIIRSNNHNHTSNWQKDLEKLIANHEFIVQATVSNGNFFGVYNTFKKIDKIKYIIGSHPEIVDQDFDLSSYLQNQTQMLKKIDLDEVLTSDITNNQGLSSAKISGEVLGIFLQAKQNLVGMGTSLEKRIIGIGECGLDYYYTQDSRIIHKQKELFESQIDLAIKLDIPLFIHTRDAFDDTFEILKSKPGIHGKFAIHCFTGNKNHLKEVLDMGGKAAFGGIITFGKNAEYLREAFAYCPKDGYLLETDLPFLSPKPFRGKDNLPEYIKFVAEKMGQIVS